MILDVDDGMKGPCAVNLHNVVTVSQDRLRKRIASLSAERMHEICLALPVSSRPLVRIERPRQMAEHYSWDHTIIYLSPHLVTVISCRSHTCFLAIINNIQTTPNKARWPVWYK